MKRLITQLVAGAALVSGLCGCAATPGAPSGPIVLTSIHEAPGRTPAQLCASAREWVLSRMPGGRTPPTMVDPAHLVARGQTSVYSMGGPVLVDFVLQVECRDGRARSTIESLTAWHGGAEISLAPNKILMIRENAEPKLRAPAADW